VLLDESPDGLQCDLLAVACDVGDLVERSLELVRAVLMPTPWVHSDGPEPLGMIRIGGQPELPES